MPKTLTIASTRVHNGVWLLELRGDPRPHRRRGAARHAARLDAEAATATDDEDAFYEDDLVGLEARDPSGAVVGTVTGLEIGAAQDRLVLTLTDGVTAYVPFVRHMVPVVAEDHVVVDPPAGLFDLYREGTE